MRVSAWDEGGFCFGASPHPEIICAAMGTVKIVLSNKPRRIWRLVFPAATLTTSLRWFVTSQAKVLTLIQAMSIRANRKVTVQLARWKGVKKESVLHVFLRHAFVLKFFFNRVENINFLGNQAFRFPRRNFEPNTPSPKFKKHPL